MGFGNSDEQRKERTSIKVGRDLLRLEVALELEKATMRFTQFASPHEGLAIIEEEVHELRMEVYKQHDTPGRPRRMRKEAIQVAAMAVRFVRDLL